MKRLLVILPIGALLLSGCPEPDVPQMQVANLTDETIIFVPKDPEYAYLERKLAPGDQRGVSRFPPNCEKSPGWHKPRPENQSSKCPGAAPNTSSSSAGPASTNTSKRATAT